MESAPWNSSNGTTIIAIVSYNTRELLRACLRSIVDQAAALDGRVVVVDNASSDGSAHMVQTGFPSVCLLALDRNVGFGKATNVAFASSDGPDVNYLLLLNSDTVMPPNGLARLVAYADQRPDIGAFTCALRGPAGELERACLHLPRLSRRVIEALALHRLVPGIGLAYRDWPFTAEHEVEHATAAVLLIRASVWRALGGFDERFFVYFEDTDLSWRLRRLGVRVIYWPGIAITHSLSASSTTPERKAALYLTSQTLAYRKWYGRAGAVIIQALEASYTLLFSVEACYHATVRRDPLMAVCLRANVARLRWLVRGKWLRPALSPDSSVRVS